MAGRMFGILAAVLLLLFAGAVVVWVRSYRTTDVVAHSGDYLWQVAVARGQVWVQRVGYFERVKDWHVVSESGPPEGALTEYVETRASYVEGAARLERVFGTWRWASDRSGGWRWTSEPPGVPVLVASPGVGESVPGWWPGARPVALRASARWIERTRLGPGVTVRGTEQWFIGRTITVPLWMIAAALALPAGWVCAAWVKRWRVRRWVDENRCAACGYDLRATPGRCPECGVVPSKVPA